MRYKRSQFLQSVQCTPEYTIVFHSFFGRGLVIKTDIAEALISAVTPGPLSQFKHISCELLQDFMERDFLIQAKVPERESVVGQFMNNSSKRIRRLTVTAANICNFECYHCIHSTAGDLDGRVTIPEKIPFEICRLAVDWIAGSLLEQGDTHMVINFSGGEPLLNWSVIKKTLLYLKKRYGSQLYMDISINTNASLITHEIARMLKKSGVHILTSLDGTKEGNNRTRKMKSGPSAFDHIMKALKLFTSESMPIKAIHISLNANNFDYIDDSFIDLLSHKGIISMTIDPDLTDRLPHSVSALVHKIMTLRIHARKKNIRVTGYWERPFARIIQKEKNLKTHFCYSMGGETVDLLPDGSIYGCSYTDMKLGHIEECVYGGSPDHFIHSVPYLDMVQSRRVGHIIGCKGCEIEGVCGGGCYVTTAHAVQKNDSAIVAYRCDFYREITKRLLIDAVEQVLLS
jgi:radical SAM protein with 4Fe4S-binding SPASM domain